MHTISTLCATSTVGIAACGYALALPHSGANNDHLISPAFRANPPPPLMADPPALAHCKVPPPDSPYFPQLPPDNLLSSSNHSLPRNWLSRFSAPFSSKTSSTASSTRSSAVSSTFRVPSHSSCRPPTRNKLVKKPPSQRTSRSNSPALPRPSRRPSTAIVQPPTREQAHRLPFFHVSRPSTAGVESSSLRPYNPEAVGEWRPFFSANPSKLNQPAAGRKLTKVPVIRRILPDFLRRRYGPALVIAPAVNNHPTDRERGDDDDSFSVFSFRSSLDVARTASHMAEMQHHQRSSRLRPATAATPISRKDDARRRFSLSNFLGGSNSGAAAAAAAAAAKDAEDEANGAGGGVVAKSTTSTFSRRYSVDEYPSPYPSHLGTRPRTAIVGPRNDPLPPIQSLSRLALNSEASASTTNIARPAARELPPVAPPRSPINDNPAYTIRPHRLSIRSASERGSTLIGSESERDFGSDTVFDSMRTRMSDASPLRADNIFDVSVGSPSVDSSDDAGMRHKATPVSQLVRGASDTAGRDSWPDSTHTAQPKVVVDHNVGWTSDWDVPSRSANENEDEKFPVPSGLHPYSGLVSGPPNGSSAHSNASNTTFNTAPEGYSSDEKSAHDANSVFDWDDDASVDTAIQPRGNPLERENASLTPRQVPSFHTRSQSMPLVTTLRDKKPLPSENWDDDFLDEEDDDYGLPKGEMVIPRAIEERQASVITHLGCVREFALLVEDLKGMKELAIAKNIRDNVNGELWDEADAIIALASLDDDEEDAPLKKDKFHRQNTWSREQSTDELVPPSRLSTVLSPEDDIFGANDKGVSYNTDASYLSHSSSSLLSWKIDKNDPVEVAKGMMEKMQHRQRSDRLTAPRRATTGSVADKVHFNTDMLRDLVIQTRKLKQKLSRAIEGSGIPLESGLKLKIGPTENSVDGAFDFDLSPIKTSLDENIGVGVGSKNFEFPPVIGVA